MDDNDETLSLRQGGEGDYTVRHLRKNLYESESEYLRNHLESGRGEPNFEGTMAIA